jgi:hypothetical protein
MAFDHEGSPAADDYRRSGASGGGGGAVGKRTLTQGLVQRAAGSSGTPLPDGVQAKFEGSLGADLSGVRVHTGGESADAAKSIGAQAYAHGNDIHFAAGKYQPDDPYGMHLLAHEVAHTVQQGGATTAGPQLRPAGGGAYDAAERDADRAADAMVRGERTRVGSAPAGGVQCFFDDILDAASNAVSDAVNAVSSAFSGGGGESPAPEVANQAAPQPAPTPAPAPKPSGAPDAGPKAPTKPRYDQHDEYQHYNHRHPEQNGYDELSLQARREAHREQLRREDEQDENYVDAKESEVTRLDVYRSLARAGSDTDAFRRLMVGHSFSEQGGKNVVHHNYAGIELWGFTRPKSDKRKYTRALRSDIIKPAQYYANPDFFWDWEKGGHGTIKQQLDKGSQSIYCLFPGPRAVFADVDDATKFFRGTIMSRVNKCLGSENTEYQTMARSAIAGDVESYVRLVTLTDKDLKILPYNGNAEYPGLIRPHLQKALVDPKLTDE